jgi:hypothetical protein
MSSYNLTFTKTIIYEPPSNESNASFNSINIPNSTIHESLPLGAPKAAAALAFKDCAAVLVRSADVPELFAGISKYWPGVELCAADGGQDCHSD